jgi:hypothetical protein
MLGWVSGKKSSFFMELTLNLHRGKMVKSFTFFQVYVIFMAKFSQTNKNRAL